MIDRRRFLARAGLGAAALAFSGHRARAVAQVPARGAPDQGVGATSSPGLDSANLFAMDQMATKPVRLPPKPGARPSMTPDERDAVEHQIRCQCGCTLDVYTCRTTDFSCQVSPAMHADVTALVAGGYTTPEILDAFVRVYGERVLMMPRTEGFNLVGYLAPFAALAAGAVAVSVIVWRWGRRPGRPAGSGPPFGLAASGSRQNQVGNVLAVDATPQELAELDAAVKEDG